MQNPPAHPASIDHLLHQLTPFVGREAEVADTLRMLDDNACRLITIIGPGGMGKTRLALRVAELTAERFSDGCCWVSLQMVQSTDFLLSVLVDALGLNSSGEALTQLSHYLKYKQLLLIMDNFEHLLDASPLLTTILAAAPGVKIIVTSREALNLHEEWVHHLEGLPFPSAERIHEAAVYPAVELFVTSARRAAPDFTLAAEQQAVIRICQHVAGMPLALEIAASWLRALTCAEIAAEIQSGLDLLTTRTRNIPERHRSIEVIFAQTYAMLAKEAQEVYKRLAVFRGSFTREAAEVVAGAAIPSLSALVDKALIKHDTDGRYTMHELVRQYAESQLRAAPGVLADTRGRHSIYYMNFLDQWGADLMGGRQKEAVAAIKADLDNVRLAWQWAIEQVEVEHIQKAATSFANYCQIQSQYQEAADIFERAAQAVAASQHAQAAETHVLLQAYQSGFYLRLGRLEDAETVLRACQAAYERLGILPVPGFTTDPAFNLGILALIRGDYAAALEHGEQVRQTSETHNHTGNRHLAYHLLAEAAIGLGDYHTAQQYAQQSYSMVAEAGNRWFMAYAYNQLGMIAYALEDYATAQQYYEASYDIRAEFHDPEGMALALRHTGEIMLHQQMYDQARTRFEKSLAIYNRIHDRGGLAHVVVDLARIDLTQGDYAAACQKLRQGLEVAAEIHFVSLILNTLVIIAALLVETEQAETAARLLAVVRQQPALAPETRQKIEQLITQRDIQLPAEAVIEPLTLVVNRLLLNFPEVSPAMNRPGYVHMPKFRQGLIEPLTEREQEVLHYIAEGLSNREIAAAMFVSVSTVKSHINSIYGKLNVVTRDEAINRAQALNLL